MGLNMATRLVRGGHRVVGFARSKETVQEAVKNGVEGAASLEDAVSKLNAPRIVWVMCHQVRPRMKRSPNWKAC